MASIFNFQKPDEIVAVKEENNTALFEFKPLESGFGLTVGHAIRRVLLSSLEGYAFSSFKIEGVLHEFSSIDGVLQDVSHIAMNLKSIRLKSISNEHFEEVISFTINGKDFQAFTAGDISKKLKNFEVTNPEVIICNLEPNASFTISFSIAKGRGYVTSEELKSFVASPPIGTVFLDSVYTPIRNVKYEISDYRVGKKTDYEMLCLGITTDGTITPKEALLQAADILITHFTLFSDRKRIKEQVDVEKEEMFDEKVLLLKHLLKTRLDDLEISVRAKNCLGVAGIKTLMDLVSHSVSDRMQFRNFGKKSLDELGELLKSKGLSFGMDVTPYLSDNDKNEM